ncbi:MAG: hypothetical protein A2Y24_05370 [Clostridiales bacterium GWE2_32_10]|nr:MAG: hypothetical protein A2Y24_05370 [Clostridiales bacterium GWE2_32_10]HBY19892.1 polysaccharide deacetylase [Clostridiales bacterium]
MKKIIYVVLFTFVICLAACTNNETVKKNMNDTKNTIDTEKESSSNIKKVLTKEDYKNLKVNELGEIPVIMYHGLVDENPPTPYQRRREDFKNDLQYLYDNKYRLISMKDFTTHNISVEAGCTPVVLTFDDGEPTDFSLIKKDGKLVLTPDCAVDILEKFNEEHPNFGKTATFYINGGKSQFEGAGTYAERLKYLVDNGYEIGNHTYSHKELSKLDATKLQEEIGKLVLEVNEELPNYTVDTLTYPFGIRPKTDELKAFIKEGSYSGKKYTNVIAFREGPSMPKMLPTIHKSYDMYNAPRLRGASNDKNGADLWGYLKKYRKKPELRYISDGDDSTIVIPKNEEQNLAENKIKDKKVIIY